jgi:hypothetical protein
VGGGLGVIARRVRPVVIFLVALLTIEMTPIHSVAAAPADCVKTDVNGTCITEITVPTSGTPSEDPAPTGQPVRDGPPGPAGHPPCSWVNTPATSTFREMFPDAPPDAVFQVMDCGAFDIQAGVNLRWVPPGTPVAPAPPTPGAVAQLLLARVKVQMVAPKLASDPPVGVSAVVNTPVFVEVTNWQPQVEDSECVLGVCVAMTATPTLSFDPGDGSGSMVCDPPGSRYVPGGAPLADQAVGACAHTYLQRTGVAGRPSEWPGSVSVTWDVNWTLVGGGASGSYDPLVFTTPFARAVEEVSAVVVEGST